MQHIFTEGEQHFTMYKDTTGLSMVRFLRNKSEAAQALRELMFELLSVYKKQGTIVRYITTDDAKKFCISLSKIDFEGRVNTRALSTILTTFQLNSKRLNRMLMDIARPLLSHVPSKELRDVLWA